MTLCARFCNVCFCYDSNNYFILYFQYERQSVLCLLGLGLGLGSLLVYRFCTRLFSSSRTKTSSSRNSKGQKTLLRVTVSRQRHHHAIPGSVASQSALPRVTADPTAKKHHQRYANVFLHVHCVCIYGKAPIRQGYVDEYS